MYPPAIFRLNNSETILLRATKKLTGILLEVSDVIFPRSKTKAEELQRPKIRGVDTEYLNPWGSNS